MIDLKIDANGDWEIDEATGDLKLTGSNPLTDEDFARAIAQLAYFAVKTERTDFTFHPDLGHELKTLLGAPNKQETSESGKALLSAALKSVGITNPVKIEAWPEDLNTIAYEISITVGGPKRVMKMTIKQALDAIE